METPEKRMKQKKQGFDKRSPLRNLHLNRLQFHKSRIKRCSQLSSSLSASRTPLLLLQKTSNNVSVKSSSVTIKVKPRSKGNEVPKKSLSEKSKKTQQQCFEKRRFGTAHKSNLRFGKVAISKIGFEEDMTNSNGLSIESNLNCTARLTPLGKEADFMSFDFCKNARDDSVSTTVKTPPVEDSVSPEIQRVSHSKMWGSKSSATPVCYGAGHLLSGVSDKRKCRRRGSLRGGIEKVNLFDDEQNAISYSQDSSIPLPAEASVRWLLSPCDEGGIDAEIRPEESKLIHGNASLAFCGNVSDLGCENSSYSVSDSLLDESEFKGKIDSLLAVNPNSTSNCDNLSFGDGEYVRQNVIENSSAFSLGSLSSGNIIRTPNSNSSSYGNVVQFGIDSITETLNAVSISPRSEMSDSIFPVQLQENVESVCSWVYDSTLEGLSLSQAKISWREGLVCKVDENDEFDCTPCLSDEQNDAVGWSGKKILPYQLFESEGDDVGVNRCLRNHWGIEFKGNEDNAVKMNLDASPILLEYEPCISVRGKEKVSEDRLNACAESICTNGSFLAASCDSDCK